MAEHYKQLECIDLVPCPIYLAIRSGQYGPLTGLEAQEIIGEKGVVPTDQVWYATAPGWMPLLPFAAHFGLLPQPPAPDLSASVPYRFGYSSSVAVRAVTQPKEVEYSAAADDHPSPLGGAAAMLVPAVPEPTYLPEPPTGDALAVAGLLTQAIRSVRFDPSNNMVIPPISVPEGPSGSHLDRATELLQAAFPSEAPAELPPASEAVNLWPDCSDRVAVEQEWAEPRGAADPVGSYWSQSEPLLASDAQALDHSERPGVEMGTTFPATDLIHVPVGDAEAPAQSLEAASTGSAERDDAAMDLAAAAESMTAEEGRSDVREGNSGTRPAALLESGPDLDLEEAPVEPLAASIVPQAGQPLLESQSVVLTPPLVPIAPRVGGRASRSDKPSKAASVATARSPVVAPEVGEPIAEADLCNLAPNPVTRIAASVIDLTLASLGGLGLGVLIAGIMGQAANALAFTIYAAVASHFAVCVLIPGAAPATAGQWMLSITPVRIGDGARVTFAQSISRYCATWLSLGLLLPPLFSLMRRDGVGLQDKISRSVMIQRRSYDKSRWAGVRATNSSPSFQLIAAVIYGVSVAGAVTYSAQHGLLSQAVQSLRFSAGDWMPAASVLNRHLADLAGR